MSLDSDKVESSNQNLKAVHAGASTRKTRRLQPNASDAADADGGLFCLFKTRVPHSSTLLSKSQVEVGRKARFASQNNHFESFLNVLTSAPVYKGQSGTSILL